MKAIVAATATAVLVAVGRSFDRWEYGVLAILGLGAAVYVVGRVLTGRWTP